MAYNPTIGRWLTTDPIGQVNTDLPTAGIHGATPTDGDRRPRETNVSQQAQARAAEKTAALFGEDHALDRWLWEIAVGPNAYEYISGNPLSGTDPSGLDRYVTTGAGLPGHHGLAVDEWALQNGKWVKTGITTYDFSMRFDSGWVDWVGVPVNVLGLPTGGMVRRTAGINGTIMTTIPSCPQADLYLTGTMEQQMIDPPVYQIYYHNCNWWIQTHLLDGIKLISPPPLPPQSNPLPSTVGHRNLRQ